MDIPGDAQYNGNMNADAPEATQTNKREAKAGSNRIPQPEDPSKDAKELLSSIDGSLGTCNQCEGQPEALFEGLSREMCEENCKGSSPHAEWHTKLETCKCFAVCKSSEGENLKDGEGCVVINLKRSIQRGDSPRKRNDGGIVQMEYPELTSESKPEVLTDPTRARKSKRLGSEASLEMQDRPSPRRRIGRDDKVKLNVRPKEDGTRFGFFVILAVW
eukprot:CAMPEP_0170183786 /NCGR_PEP_ID=MMETSP0040_2-20121228/31711_1 /TAXON_ID=641309 /ORGANISM="Lotharella oceanica, Strain CCMP622" /LENGTH=216 /DNA_ID=CAMNT_0010429633 /DNA_START=29 /DNA_END=676 /DNA_ORIENTATION=+